VHNRLQALKVGFQTMFFYINFDLIHKVKITVVLQQNERKYHLLDSPVVAFGNPFTGKFS